MEKYAQLVALSIVHSAQNDGYLAGPLTVIEELADVEKDLFIAMLKQVKLHLSREDRVELDGEEVMSLFTFVLAKAAEAVSELHGQNPIELDLMGMLDGKIPFYCHPQLEKFCHITTMPSDFATAFKNFYNHYGDALHREGVEPILILMEALKWSWRISVHICYELLEKK